jgi:hypothetical protein
VGLIRREFGGALELQEPVTLLLLAHERQAKCIVKTRILGRSRRRIAATRLLHPPRAPMNDRGRRD